jgi:cysteinyl-tRNA synthetase
MRIFDTLSGEKKEVFPGDSDRLNLFVCGPTVYDESHIGHARTFLAFDIFVRYLRSRGFNVFYLQNITNVDDKIIDRARKEGKKPFALARVFEKAYYRDMKAIGATAVTKYARAGDFIPEIVRQVETLKAGGFAYEIPGDGWYFDISKFADYGKLSKRTALQAEDSVSRIDENVKKRNRGDFALWKFQKTADEPAWATSLGKGRPGWHIEDTAITEKFFGPQYDIHGGAVDLKFPHHEAEIAQQESASGLVPFVRVWMHAGSLLVDGQKMSKSLKNFVTIADFLKGDSAAVIRWIALSHHYRSPVNFTAELVAQAKASLGTVKEFIAKLELIAKKNKGKKLDNFGVKESIEKCDRDFHGAMEDDFNTPLALGALFGLIATSQSDIWKTSATEAKMLEKYLIRLLQTLGLSLKAPKIPAEAEKIAAERELCRTNKQFIQADALRNRVRLLGYEIEDTPLGPWLKQK